MGKIDIHLHLGCESVERVLGRTDRAGTTYVSGNTPHDTVMKMSGTMDMLGHLQELGISKGILLSGGETPVMGSSNEEVEKAAGLAPGVYAWMCNLDPENPDTVEERLAEYKRRGAVGIGEFAVNQWIGSPFIEAVFAAAEKLELPILFHMSPEEGFNYGIADRPGLPLLEEALRKYGSLTFIGHSQPFWHEISAGVKDDIVSRNSWGEGTVRPGGRLPYLLETYPNLYADLSANSGGHAVMRDEAYGLAFLEKFQDKLMFGTDMTNTEMVFPLGGWLDQKLAEGRLSRGAYEKICVTNAERLFGTW